ncbi:MAG: hypothetical protein KAG66_04670, partial [Methylococcales bacterium]|nr:hypothetical protein [Methylococcales bacterium]
MAENNDISKKTQIFWWGVGGIALFLCLCTAALGFSGSLYLLGDFIELPDIDTPPTTITQAEATAEPDVVIVPTAEVATPVSAPVTLNRIVFIGQDGKVHTINPDGSQPHKLASEQGVYQYPVWSPDGTRIAVIGGDQSAFAVHVLVDTNDDDVEPIIVYDEAESAPIHVDWSPDSSQLAILANTEDSLGLFIADAGRADTGRLLVEGQPFYWDWLPDGLQLLIHNGIDTDEEKLTFLDASNGTMADNIAIPGAFQAPDVFSDGEYWAFSRESDSGAHYVVAQNRLTGAEATARHAGTV